MKPGEITYCYRLFTFCEFHTELNLIHQVTPVTCQNMLGFKPGQNGETV